MTLFVRLGLPAAAVLGAAWMLVQPDTPRPEATAPAVEQVADVAEQAPSSAVELLGETWTVEAPAPVVRPLTAAEHAEVMAAMRNADSAGTGPVGSPAEIYALRRPMPRPERVARAVAPVEYPANDYSEPVDYAAPVEYQAPPNANGSFVVTAPGGAPLEDPPAVLVLRGDGSAVVPGQGEPRWVVRQQGSGNVIAEVSLAEALAILTSR